jgi:class 3 adenylate cyclase
MQDTINLVQEDAGTQAGKHWPQYRATVPWHWRIGFVAKHMGDGVLIYFGYPEAHEDDAERAARAGLAVIAAVGRLATQEPLNVRIGIASGLVVVGDLIGAGAAQERGVVGGTPNLAARLQALARAGTLLVADRTRRQIGTLFEIEDLGPQPLAGFAKPQRAWRVVGESGVVSRFEALRSGATPLVGRDEELDLLSRRWQQVKSGAGRVVLVSGEPGIGKSRLTAALSQDRGFQVVSPAGGRSAPVSKSRQENPPCKARESYNGAAEQGQGGGKWNSGNRSLNEFTLKGEFNQRITLNPKSITR